MTKPKLNLYQIHYTDNNCRMIEWTKAEFKQVAEDMKGGFETTILDDGVFRLNDIRAIVFVPEPEEPESKKEEPTTDDWGFVDTQTAEWLKAQGIDIRKGGLIYE